VKFVIAPGAIKTDEPNITAENNKIEKDGNTKGVNEPMEILVKIIDNGTPFPNLAKIDRHINGDMHMKNPSTNQMAVIISAFMD
tara:strand:- start:45 stop:296 length:252 start_codon:yes stop_codon:yes gene_type:complete